MDGDLGSFSSTFLPRNVPSHSTFQNIMPTDRLLSRRTMMSTPLSGFSPPLEGELNGYAFIIACLLIGISHLFVITLFAILDKPSAGGQLIGIPIVLAETVNNVSWNIAGDKMQFFCDFFIQSLDIGISKIPSLYYISQGLSQGILQT